MASFGGLAAGLGVGAMAELARRSVGLTNQKGWSDSWDMKISLCLKYINLFVGRSS